MITFGKLRCHFLVRLAVGRIARCLPGNRLACVRAMLWRAAGLTVGRGVNIYHSVSILVGEIAVGDHSYVGPDTLITGGSISIGRNCDISARVILHAGTHEPGGPARRAGRAVTRPIVIGDGVWIGAGATVIAGVSIGNSSVVGAGAVVTVSIPDHALAVGVPARVVRSLESTKR